MNFTYFEIHLCEHCNLKCRSCDNFSSIAEEEFVDVESFRIQMKQMANIVNGKINRIRLLGGEPLLHPQINELLVHARTCFLNADLLLTTNGILLNKMGRSFWKTCHDNNITIEITYYPINIDRTAYEEKGKQYDVKIIPFDNKKTTTKVTHRNPINDKKDQDIHYNYEHCYQRWRCMSLKDGKLYPCTCIPNIYHFNKFFNKNLEVTDKDYIDIFTTTDVKEIETFLDQAPPFCAYCNLKNRTDGKPWSVTNKELEEWFDE